jgi:hypothetical protein
MRLTVLLSLAAVAGCSSPPVVESAPAPETVRVVGGAAPGAIVLGMSASSASSHATMLNAPVADVWRALLGAYESLSIPLSMVDSPRRLVGNSGFNARRRLGSLPLVRLLDCGATQGGPSAETYDIRLSVITQLKPEGAGTALSTSVEAMGKPVAFSGEYIRCSSTGVLESRLADAVNARLAK